jgi:lysophospholipase L1-like esterase
VLAQSGVKYAMVFEGVNDIGVAADNASAQAQTGDRLIQAYKQMITRVHTHGIPFFGATITPFGCHNSSIQAYSTVLREQTRLRVNDWIRNSGAFDAVLDFDAVLRDPKNQTQLLAPWPRGVPTTCRCVPAGCVWEIQGWGQWFLLEYIESFI